MPDDVLPTSDAAGPAAGLAGLVVAYLDAQYAALSAGDAALRAGDAEAVHPTRVASRRYRSVLRELTTLFDENEAVVLEESLRWWGRVLGRVRDVHIVSERLDEAIDALPDGAGRDAVRRLVADHLDVHRAQTWAALAKALDRTRYASMMGRLEAFHDDPDIGGGHRPAEDVAQYVERAVARYHERVEEAVGAQAGATRRHEARKAAKQARYVAELARPALGPTADEIARTMTEAQDRLGLEQDRVTVRGFLDEVADDAEDHPRRLGPAGRRALGLLRAEFV